MPVTLLTPSVEQRTKAYLELGNRAKRLVPVVPSKPTITISREFGCEAFPVGEELVKQLERMTDETWILVDKSLLDEVAREQNISEDTMRSLGQKPRWLDDMFATLSPRWKSDRDYYQFLVEQVVSIATAGNAVIVGLGAAIISTQMKNCHHFRLIANKDFKVASIARRMNLSKQEAELLVIEQQKERDRIIRKLLDVDESDPLYYHLIFNNGRVGNQKIARIIADTVVK